ncbi:WD40-repeat-containing domain protein [Aspergillus egyptiacus]|nr:WD40-repeat-containing domain protein [Aspergillus egyptiacus]
MRPHAREQFRLAIICALPLEADAVKALFDETYDRGPRYGDLAGDTNAYSTGRIGQHHVPGVQLALVVGICGAVPFTDQGTEIVLGDVIISDSVVEYDFGRQYADEFRRKTDAKDTLGRPNREIRAILATLKTRETRQEFHERTSYHLRALQGKQPLWEYPGSEKDILLAAPCGSDHQHHNDDEASPLCRPKPFHRRRLEQKTVVPFVHIGTVACANTVMKSAEHRDRLAQQEGVIAFEMEGAGVWDDLPCVIIKGVCDYADSSKNKLWQEYAAATGAAWITAENCRCLGDLLRTDPRDDKLRIEQAKGGLHSLFQKWRCDEQTSALWIRGDAGKGKTMLMIAIIDELTKSMDGSSRVDGAPVLSYFLCQGTDARLNNAASVRPTLLRHLREKYDHAGRRLFDGQDQFYSLTEPFLEMIQDPSVPETYFVVDAVDECETELPQLLDLITRSTSLPSNVKWVLSSRNRKDIAQRLGACHNQKYLRLELNPDQIEQAIGTFIDYRVSRLTNLSYHPVIRDRLEKDSLAVDALEIVNHTLSGIIALFDQMMERVQQLQPRNLQRCLQTLSAAVLAYRPLHLLELRIIAGLPREITQLPDLDKIVTLCGSFLTVRDNHVYFIHQLAKDYLVRFHRSIIHGKGQDESHYLLKNPGPISEQERCRDAALTPVKYCCIYWFDHLYQSGRAGNPDIDLIFAFFNKNFLNWLECLGLMRSMTKGIHILKQLLDAMKHPVTVTSAVLDRLKSYGTFLVLLKDCFRHALAYGKTIEDAPLQVYNASLIFCPQGSDIKTRFWDGRPPYIKTVAGLTEHWSSCLQTIEAHTNHKDSSVNAVCYAPNRQSLATGSSDRTIKVWDAITGFLKQTLKGHQGPVNAIFYLQDNETLVSGSDDGTILLWHIVSGTFERIYKSYEERVLVLSYSPESGTLAAGLRSGTVFKGTYNSIEVMRGVFAGKELLRRTGKPTNVSHQSSEGIISRKDYTRLSSVIPYLDDLTRQARECKRLIHSSEVMALSMSYDGGVIACAWGNGAVRLWHSTSEMWEDIHRDEKDSVIGLDLSPDGSILALAIDNGHLRLWDQRLHNWRQIIKIEELESCLCAPISFAPDGQSLLLASAHMVFQWTSRSGRAKPIINMTSSRRPGPPSGAAHASTQCPPFYFRAISTKTAFKAFCFYLFLVLSLAITIHSIALLREVDHAALKCICYLEWCRRRYRWAAILWRFGIITGTRFITGQYDRVRRDDDYAPGYWGHLGRITSMIFSPDAQTLATASWDRNIHLWDTAANTWRQGLVGHTQPIWLTKFFPDSRHLLWDTFSGTCRKTFAGKTHDVFLSPNGATVVSVSDSYTMRLWDATGTILSVDISVNGEILASASEDCTVRLWDAKTGASRYVVKCDASLSAIAYNGTLRLWDSCTKAWTHTFDSLSKHPTCLAFAPDGHNIAVSSTGGHLAIHDSSTGACLRTFAVPPIQDVRYSETGRSLITCQGHICLDPEPNRRPEAFRAFSIDGEWVSFNNQKIIWLPPSYRKPRFAVYNSTLVLGLESGRIIFIQLDIDLLYELYYSD